MMRRIGVTELQAMNTFELNVKCPDVWLITDPEELTTYLRAFAPERRRSLHIAGELSNTVLGDLASPLLLFRDGNGFDISTRGETVLVRAAGSCHFDALVTLLCEKGISGLELLSGIPGTVGSAIVQNIAAYGQRLSGHFVSARAFDLERGSIVELDADAMNFSYRSSSLKDPNRYTPKLIILDAILQFGSSGILDSIAYADLQRLHAERGRHPQDLLGRRSSVLELRQRKGMVVGGDNWIPSAGSFFMSPVVPTARAVEIAKLVRGSQFAETFLSWYKPDAYETRCPAALVMRAAGFLNGDRWDAVGLSPNHILAICSFAPATASDVAAVAAIVQSKVAETLGISMETEVRYAGSVVIPDLDAFLRHHPFSSGVGEPHWVLGMDAP
jgi:UDP-N-acetylmuramate dehydrogenase